MEMPMVFPGSHVTIANCDKMEKKSIHTAEIEYSLRQPRQQKTKHESQGRINEAPARPGDPFCGVITSNTDDRLCEEQNTSDEQLITSKELQDAQRKDPNIGQILQWKGTLTNRPQWADVSPESAEVKSYWSQWDRLQIRDQILCRRW